MLSHSCLLGEFMWRKWRCGVCGGVTTWPLHRRVFLMCLGSWSQVTVGAKEKPIGVPLNAVIASYLLVCGLGSRLLFAMEQRNFKVSAQFCQR